MPNEKIEDNKSDADFYLLIIAIKLGFLSLTKILKGIYGAYKWHRSSLKKKYQEANIEAANIVMPRQ